MTDYKELIKGLKNPCGMSFSGDMCSEVRLCPGCKKSFDAADAIEALLKERENAAKINWNRGWNAHGEVMEKLSTQPQVPGVSAMARVLSDRTADACNVNREDHWHFYSDEFIADVEAMLQASPQPSGEKS